MSDGFDLLTVPFNEPNASTPYGDVTYVGNQAYGPLGLPIDVSVPPPGLAPNSSAEGSNIVFSSIQTAWHSVEGAGESLVKGAGSAARDTYGGMKNLAGTVYDDLRKGAGTVYDDIKAPLTSALTGTYWYLLLGVAVIGGVVYFAGKSGAVRMRV